MSKLNELSMALDFNNWHYFLQRLPYISQLRALHIPHIISPSQTQLELKELALQVLDIVTLRPEINLSYIGIRDKCYEILEGKGGEYDSASTDDTHNEGFVPGAENWTGSDTNDDDSNEDDEESRIEYQSDMSEDNLRSLDDDDGSDYDYGRSRVSFRLREILFYDDKIAIFKARHGVL
jgi:nucleosome binding factor SPN SPT16 subunit